MNHRDHPETCERLAAEYVVGTLQGGARRRFERWLHGDAALRRSVAEWQQRLVPMAEFAPPETPPARVWQGIERRLQLRPAATSWRDPLQWWRLLGVVSTTAAAVLAAVLVLQKPVLQEAGPQIDRIATLTDERAQVALLVTSDQRNGVIAVRVVGQTPVPDDRTLQLWAITKAGTPRSLGILDARGAATFAATDRALGSDVAVLAVSLEPKGGSPNPAAPTGPVLYKGGWVNVN